MRWPTDSEILEDFRKIRLTPAKHSERMMLMTTTSAPNSTGQSLGEYLVTLRNAGFIVSKQQPMLGGYRYRAVSCYGDPDVIVEVRNASGRDTFTVLNPLETAEQCLKVAEAYDAIVRTNEARKAVADCNEDIYGAWGEFIDTANECGFAVSAFDEDTRAVDMLRSTFDGWRETLRAELALDTRTYDMDVDEWMNGGQEIPARIAGMVNENGMVPRLCQDCQQPAYYDTADENYHHAYDPSDGCFLIPSEDRAPDYRHPLMTGKRGV